MSIRSLTAFSLLTVLALGLPACGDDKDPMVTASNTSPTTNTPPTTNTTPAATDGTGTTAASETSETDAMTGTEATSEPETTTPTTTVPGTTTTTEPATTTESTSTTGTTADPETSTTDDTGGGSDGAYGPCGMTCPAGTDCVSLDGVEGMFCSPQCGPGVMCPMPDNGAMGQCALVLGMGMDPTNCAAICDVQMQNCPEGTTCKAIPMQMFGVCTAP